MPLLIKQKQFKTTQMTTIKKIEKVKVGMFVEQLLTII